MRGTRTHTPRIDGASQPIDNARNHERQYADGRHDRRKARRRADPDAIPGFAGTHAMIAFCVSPFVTPVPQPVTNMPSATHR